MYHQKLIWRNRIVYLQVVLSKLRVLKCNLYSHWLIGFCISLLVRSWEAWIEISCSLSPLSPHIWRLKVFLFIIPYTSSFCCCQKLLIIDVKGRRKASSVFPFGFINGQGFTTRPFLHFGRFRNEDGSQYLDRVGRNVMKLGNYVVIIYIINIH